MTGDDEPAPVAATAGPATTAAPAPTATQAPTPTAAPTLRLGQTVTLDLATATVYRYKPGGKIDDEPIGSIDVKVCNTGSEPVNVSPGPWALRFAGDTTAGAESVWSGADAAKPEYPARRTLAAGRCVRGWMTFSLPGNQRPIEVEYAPADRTPTSWAIG